MHAAKRSANTASKPAEMDSYSVLVFLAMILFADVATATAATDTHWDYQDQDEWKNIPGAVCGGNRQSPINIVTQDVITWYYPEPLTFNHAWNNNITVDKTNTGHSIQYNPENLYATVMTHTGIYKLLQFHVHWGRNEQEGSEHQVDGKQYSAEFHFVTEKLHGSVSDGDHLSVMGVLGVEDHESSITPGSLWDKMMPLTEFDAHERVTDLPFYELFPYDLSYYHYEGSLTTPPCNETVQWFVFKECISVPSAYLEALRQVKDENGHTLQYNFRDTQPLNYRNVYYG